MMRDTERMTWADGEIVLVSPARAGTAVQYASTMTGQLDMAGWSDAWRHELRGPNGEWLSGGTASAAGGAPESGSYRARLAPDGLPNPSPESLALAGKMIQPEGTTAAQRKVMARVLGDNLDRIPPQMREAMAATHKVRLSPQEDVGPEGVLGVTGAWMGSWEIRIARDVLTDKLDRDTARQEDMGNFVKTEGDTKYLALRHTITHEFGHALFELGMIESGDIFTKPGQDDAMAKPSEAIAENKITGDILRALGGPALEEAETHRAQFMHALHALSGYGASAIPEAMAESYTAFALNGKGADGSTKAREAGRVFLRDAEQNFAKSPAGAGMMVSLSVPADRPYTGCSGLPASPEDFQRLYGTPEAKAAAASAWGLSRPIEMSWHDAWRTEARGPHGEWVSGAGGQEMHAPKFHTPSWVQTLTPSTDPAADPAKVSAFINDSAGSVPGLLGGQGTHLDFDGKPPKLYPASSDPGTLAEIDWSGHMRMSDEVAADITRGLDPGKPITVPASFVVPLHELIHAALPAGQVRATNGDKAAYQEHTHVHADIEEGFTQLGAAQHAEGYFTAAGIGDREIKLEDSPPGVTMNDLARLLAAPERIRNGDSWGSYPALTAQAHNWVSLIAQQRTGKGEKDPATAAEIIKITDEINRQGTAGKPRVMARQVVDDMNLDPQTENAVLGEAERSILESWFLDAEKAVSKVRETASQKAQQYQAEQADRAAA